MPETSQFLYMIKPTRVEMLLEGPIEREAEIISAHFKYLQDLLKRDILILAGRTLNTDDSSFGIVIFAADSKEEAQEVVDQDPAVRQGVMEAQLYPYRVALTANG